MKTCLQLSINNNFWNLCTMQNFRLIFIGEQKITQIFPQLKMSLPFLCLACSTGMQISKFYILAHTDRKYDANHTIWYLTWYVYLGIGHLHATFLLNCSSHAFDPVAIVTRPLLNNGQCLTPQTCTFILCDILLHNYMHIFYQYHVTAQT